jgi:plastocyanin
MKILPKQPAGVSLEGLQMRLRGACLGVGLLAICGAASGENIEGTIIVKRPLTKRRVTASVPLYQRGPAAELGADSPKDPLALERGRVVVYLEGRHTAPPVTALMEQEGRRFRQDTVVIPAGSRVSFPNQDPIFHNVFSLSKVRTFDLGNYAKGETRVVRFDEPGVVFVNCHLHPNMAAAILVTPNRWYARADASGAYNLPDVPPGTYTIVAWHKSSGMIRRQVEVRAGEGARVDFLVPLDDDPVPAAVSVPPSTR